GVAGAYAEVVGTAAHKISVHVSSYIRGDGRHLCEAARSRGRTFYKEVLLVAGIVSPTEMRAACLRTCCRQICGRGGQCRCCADCCGCSSVAGRAAVVCDGQRDVVSARGRISVCGCYARA